MNIQDEMSKSGGVKNQFNIMSYKIDYNMNYKAKYN